MSQSNALAAAVDAARCELQAGRERIKAMHDRGLAGEQVCGRLTSLIDQIVLRLYDAALGDCPGSARLRQSIALVGLGSYGRRQSAPYSDVDLMILHDELPLDLLTPLVRRFTHAIYDVRLELGHSVRTTSEAVQLARTDGVICSSLIDGRLVTGNQNLYLGFREAFTRMVQRRAKAIARALHDARSAERNQYGESIYLLQPHIKRSRGGLRDLHLIGWLGFVDHGESDPDRLHLKGAISKFDHRRLLSARTFLLRIRNEMHFHAMASKDELDRTEQVRLAQWRGHTHRDGLLPVEHLMRDYFRHANHLRQMVLRREAMLLTAPTPFSRLLDPVLARNVQGDYRVTTRHVTTTSSGLAKLRGDLDQVVRLVQVAAEQKKNLDQATWSTLLLAAPECPDHPDATVADRFWKLLGDRSTVGNVLRTLHELGYLERIVPAVRRARCLLQFNQYHQYTVDEHSLRAVEEATHFADRGDTLGEVYRQLEDHRLLHLALLLHDLGKGDEQDHCLVGEQLALETAAQLRLDEPTTRTLALLVRQHLNMSHHAFRRNIGDPDLVARFAQQIGSVERLRMLFVLTCADLAAVGPGVLTQWKIDILAELLCLAEQQLGSETSAPGSLERPRAKIEACLPASARTQPWFQQSLAAMPASIVNALNAQEVADLLVRLRQLAPHETIASSRPRPEAQTLEFVAAVAGGAGRGVFSRMAGALSSRGLQILSADTQVLADNLLLLHYVAVDTDFPGGTSPQRLTELETALKRAVDDRSPPKFRRVFGQERALASARLTAQPDKVRIDNATSRDATVVEVFTCDRIGLLYDLARKLHECSLTIRHAKISTSLDQVVDVFYVTQRDGSKLTDPERLQQLEDELRAVIAHVATTS
jgi:[protein-PII] uridylyltransferase